MRNMFAAGAASIFFATMANAAPAISLESPGAAYTSGLYTVGFEFELSSMATVDKLGIYDWNADGLESRADVGLWLMDGTLLATVSIGAGTAGELIDQFRFGAIEPIALQAGVRYVVGSYMPSGAVGTATSLNTGQGGVGSLNPLLSAVRDRYSDFDSAFGFPSVTDSTGGAWLGANLHFAGDVVPEPNNWAMMLAGFGLVGFAVRRRRIPAAA